MQERWKEVLDFLRSKLPPQHFETWISPMQFLDFEGETLNVEVPNSFFKSWIEENYVDLIKEAMRQRMGRACNVSFQVSERPVRSQRTPIPLDDLAPPAMEGSGEREPFPPIPRPHLNPRYTFETFIVGTSNQFAHAACQAVANGQSKYNPIFLYGGVGLGKTHLLNAIGHRFLANKPSALVVYTTAEEFVNELVSAIRYERITQFREKYRNIDLLLMDDIQFISRKERTQEEFFHTFNALYEKHTQIAITSDQFPKEIPALEERLRSRFEWGLIADIHPPELETKLAILEKKAEEEQIPLPNDVKHFLATNITSNVRELEGALIGLGAMASLSGKRITIELAQDILKNIVMKEEEQVTIEEIQRTVAEFYNLRVSQLRSNNRQKDIVHARQVAMYLARIVTNESYPHIGAHFNKKDHTTVIHACRQIKQKMKNDESLRYIVDMLRKQLEKER